MESYNNIKSTYHQMAEAIKWWDKNNIDIFSRVVAPAFIAAKEIKNNQYIKDISDIIPKESMDSLYKWIDANKKNILKYIKDKWKSTSEGLEAFWQWFWKTLWIVPWVIAWFGSSPILWIAEWINAWYNQKPFKDAMKNTISGWQELLKESSAINEQYDNKNETLSNNIYKWLVQWIAVWNAGWFFPWTMWHIAWYPIWYSARWYNELWNLINWLIK